jgi:hypothetical protein
MTAACGPIVITGSVTLQASFSLGGVGSTIPLAWQYGKP